MAGKLLSEQGPILDSFAEEFSKASRTTASDARTFFEKLGWGSATKKSAKKRAKAKKK
jgi:hypothetical protein